MLSGSGVNRRLTLTNGDAAFTRTSPDGAVTRRFPRQQVCDRRGRPAPADEPLNISGGVASTYVSAAST